MLKLCGDTISKPLELNSQRQMRDILQGASSPERKKINFSLNELRKKSQTTIILGKFVSKQICKFSENVFHWLKFKPRSDDIFFT